MTDNFWIPRTLNAPVMLFIFQADNFILVTVIMTMTGLLNVWYIGIVLSMVLVRAWNELKEAGGRVWLCVIYTGTCHRSWALK